MIDLDSVLAKEFMAECNEHLLTLEKELIAIEHGGATVDEECVNRAFRVIRSISGGAYFLDLPKIAALAKQTENSVGLLRARKAVPTPDRVDILLLATDKLRELIQDPGGTEQADISGVMAALARLAGDPSPSAPASSLSLPGKSGAKSADRSGGRLRTLVVEDDFTSRLVLQTFLSRYGDCHVAVNGREAVEAFSAASEQGQTYDLICMDIMMPEMDGPEAVRRIRARENASGIAPSKGAKITMTTAVSDVKKVFYCFKELCDAYLVKPIDLNKLLDQMKSWKIVQ